ncbi:MAG: ATPase, partial [Prevotella sp.]|nr:ATPase [Prevotella sp.]
ASLSPFVRLQMEEPAIRILVYEHFNAFVRKNVMKYNRQDLPVNFVGSMADAYRDVLTDVLKANDLLVGKIIQRPIERLAEYHS